MPDLELPIRRTMPPIWSCYFGMYSGLVKGDLFLAERRMRSIGTGTCRRHAPFFVRICEDHSLGICRPLRGLKVHGAGSAVAWPNGLLNGYIFCSLHEDFLAGTTDIGRTSYIVLKSSEFLT